MYVPFLSVTDHVVRPVPARLVRRLTPGPTSWKLRVFDVSVTTNVYFPAFSAVTSLPSWRSVMNVSPSVP